MNDKHDGKIRVFIDLETTGLDPKEHTIAQIGAVAHNEDGVEIDSFFCNVKFKYDDVSQEVLDFFGFDKELWETTGLHPMDAAKKLILFLSKYATYTQVSKNNKSYKVSRLFAHNANFDVEFLNGWIRKLSDWQEEHVKNEAKRVNLFLPTGRIGFDTLQMALLVEEFADDGIEKLSLDYLLNYYGLTERESPAHNSLEDARLTAELFYKLRDRLGF